jgi:hypothetical protein
MSREDTSSAVGGGGASILGFGASGARAVEAMAGENSQFKVKVLNALGRQEKTARNQLYASALKNPDKYITTREAIIKSIVDDLVQTNYDVFWDILTKGKLPNGDDMKLPDGDKYNPGVAEQKAGAFCMKVAESLEDIAEACIEMVMPVNHADLAIRKMVNDTRATINE